MSGMRRVFAVTLIFTVLCLGMTSTSHAFGSGLHEGWGKPVAATEDPGGPAVPLQTPTPAFVAEYAADEFAEARQLTEGDCCVLPRWTTDSEWILYIDRPDEEQPAGIYGIPADGGEASLISARIGVFSANLSLVAYPEASQTYIERWVDGNRWTIPAEGRAVHFAPDNRLVAWEVGSRAITDPDLRQKQIWVSNLDGSHARELVTVHGGGFISWAEGGRSFLVSGRLSPPDPAGIWRISPVDGAGRLLMEVVRPRSVLVSPGGDWVAFLVAFEPDGDRNGLWVARLDGSRTFKLPVIGSYRWRREGELLIIPYDGAGKDPYLLQFDLTGGEVFQLTDPEKTRLPIGNNDWEPSPDGKRIVFLSALDGNLWLLALPEP